MFLLTITIYISVLSHNLFLYRDTHNVSVKYGEAHIAWISLIRLQGTTSHWFCSKTPFKAYKGSKGTRGGGEGGGGRGCRPDAS